jgi:hypothetical protein
MSPAAKTKQQQVTTYFDQVTGNRPRIRGLDVCRGIAAIRVVLFHFGPVLTPDPRCRTAAGRGRSALGDLANFPMQRYTHVFVLPRALGVT